MSHVRAVTLLALAAVIAALAPVGTVAAGPGDSPPADDVRDIGPDYNDGKALPIRRGGFQTFRAGGGRKIGTTKDWLALDDEEASIYSKPFRLRGMGDHIEVWVATGSDDVSTGLRFPEGDCRNDERVRITKAQIRYLIREFDRNMYPRESRWFSVAPKRNGTDALLPDLVPELPANYYKGRGGNTVVLIDNVRDDNFYDTDNSQNLPYIAGFFFSLFNELHDRNIMTIDAYDWIHRTGAHPPDEPVPGDFCQNKSARPFLYEGVFAHEYQHLLEYYEDIDETIWLNEGLSDWAQTLTRYVKPRTPITELGFDSHIQCFLGNLGIETSANPLPRDSGPENGLTQWEDQGPEEILCDYGAAYTMMEFLRDRYGKDFMRKLHRGNANGFRSLTNLASKEDGATATDLVHDWAAMVALDGVLDDGATFVGGEAGTFQTRTLDALINWDTEHAFATPGAPPNGSDYVRLRNAAGEFLGAGDIDSISFDGGETLAPLPVEWAVDSNPPDHAGNPALHSGSGPNFDRSIVQEARVPENDATLTFETRYETEEAFDFGFVQVSTDGGATWTSLSNADTTSAADPGTIELIHQNLPGFNGDSGGWKTETFDLSQYAGQDVLIAFRYITDPAVDLPGWWIDDVNVGNRNLTNGTTVEGWQTMTQIRPVPVEGFTVQLVAYDDEHENAWLARMELEEGFVATLEGDALSSALGDSAETVAAIVTFDDSSELAAQYAPYVLQVNGVTQPGGS